MYRRTEQSVYVFRRFDFVYILILILQRAVSEAFYAGIRCSHLFNLMICDNINNGNRTLFLCFLMAREDAYIVAVFLFLFILKNR